MNSEKRQVSPSGKRIPELKPGNLGFSERFMELCNTDPIVNAIYHSVASGQNPIRLIEDLIFHYRKHNETLINELKKMIEMGGKTVIAEGPLQLEGVEGLPVFKRRTSESI